MSQPPATVDEYIAGFSEDVQDTLQNLRKTVREVAPGAEESISYRIPAYKLNGKVLVYFAGWADHVSLYPIPLGDDAFHGELKQYQSGKGTVRFPLDRPIPYDFIRRFVELHVQRLD